MGCVMPPDGLPKKGSLWKWDDEKHPEMPGWLLVLGFPSGKYEEIGPQDYNVRYDILFMVGDIDKATGLAKNHSTIFCVAWDWIQSKGIVHVSDL